MSWPRSFPSLAASPADQPQVGVWVSIPALVHASCELRKEGPDLWTFKTTGVAASGLKELDVRFKRATSASGVPARR